MGLISQVVKIDTALTPLNLNGASTTQRYYPMDSYRKGLFIVNTGAMITGVTSILQVMQATNADGGGAAVVTGITGTITADTRVKVATATAAATNTGDTIVVNGLTYTGRVAGGGGADLPNRIFLCDAGNDATSATGLAAAINHATAGVPGVRATANAAVVTLESIPAGAVSITVVGTAVRLVTATVAAEGYCEVDAGMLNRAAGMDHIAIRVTNSAACLTSAVLVRGEGRYTPVQATAAADFEV